mmetsp:Transcript_46357/g.119632  ORF Transcript_46357/g.119632 Transcript_46357/m.119632 type:complete len:198 (-) Transcript_46357:345-938(-)
MVGQSTALALSVLLLGAVVAAVPVSLPQPAMTVGNETGCDLCKSMAGRFKYAVFNEMRLKDRVWSTYMGCFTSYFTTVEHEMGGRNQFEFDLQKQMKKTFSSYPSFDVICAPYCNGDAAAAGGVAPSNDALCDDVEKGMRDAKAIPDFYSNLALYDCQFIPLWDSEKKCQSHVADTCQNNDDFQNGCYSDLRSRLGC